MASIVSFSVSEKRASKRACANWPQTFVFWPATASCHCATASLTSSEADNRVSESRKHVNEQIQRFLNKGFENDNGVALTTLVNPHFA